MQLIKQSESTAARRRVLVYLVDDADGKTAETGVTVSAGDVKISKNGAAEANHAGTWAELAGGLYSYEFTQGELDTLGFASLRLVKSGVRTFVKEVQVAAVDVYDGVRGGLTGLPNANAGANGGLPTIDGNLRVSANVTAMASNTVTAAAVAADAAAKINDADRSLLLKTTVSAVTSQTVFQLSSGPAGYADQYLGCRVLLRDVSVGNAPAIRRATGWDSSTGDLEIDSNAPFTVAVGDDVMIFADERLDRQQNGRVDLGGWNGVTPANLVGQRVDVSVGATPQVLVDTTVASVVDPTHLRLTAALGSNDVYNNQTVVLYDVSASNAPSVRKIVDFLDANNEIVLDAAAEFTVATGDGVRIFVTAPGTTAPTAAEVADAVLNELVTEHQSAGSLGAELHLSKAMLANKRVHTVSTGVDRVYDDNGTTLLRTMTPTDGGDDLIQVVPN